MTPLATRTPTPAYCESWMGFDGHCILRASRLGSFGVRWMAVAAARFSSERGNSRSLDGKHVTIRLGVSSECDGGVGMMELVFFSNFFLHFFFSSCFLASFPSSSL